MAPGSSIEDGDAAVAAVLLSESHALHAYAYADIRLAKLFRSCSRREVDLVT